MPRDFRDFSALQFYTSGPSLTTRAREVARWSEQSGLRGMLIYSDNRSLDSWVMAQDIITHTAHLSPLIAIQPVYMHPFAAAQKILALTRLYGRAVDLNFVAGGFPFDLAALNDRLPHDARYERLAEYGTIMMKLLRGERTTMKGRYYTVSGLHLDNGLPPDLVPRLTVAGSSPGGRACADVLGATAVTYPEPLVSIFAPNSIDRSDSQSGSGCSGIRIGILARETNTRAWEEAKAWLPDASQNKPRLEAAISATDSSWLQNLSKASMIRDPLLADVYWLGPFEQGVSFCPYLVGSYDEVALYLRGYFNLGIRLLILDAPRGEEDLEHIHEAVLRGFLNDGVQI